MAVVYIGTLKDTRGRARLVTLHVGFGCPLGRIRRARSEGKFRLITLQESLGQQGGLIHRGRHSRG